MDSSLQNSRISKADTERFRSTGTSLVFKSIGRQIKPAWGNRIVKDFNDLSYDVPIDLIGNGKFTKSFIQPKNTRQVKDRKKQTSQKNKRNLSFSHELRKPAKLKKIDITTLKNKAQSIQLENPQEAQTKYGLSDFQFKNTIDGKIKTRPQIHLKFQLQTQRSKNLHPIWYNEEFEIDLQKPNIRRYRKLLEKYHHFESYTERKVFETKDKLDKIYEIQGGKRRTSPNRIKRLVKLETVPGRKPQTIKESSYLSYEISNAEKCVSEAHPQYTIQQSPRKIQFTRQVINQSRGCYR